MNEHINDISGEIVTIVLAIGAWIMWAIRKLIGMDQRISVVEQAMMRVEDDRDEAKTKVESLMMDVSTIKADVRNNAISTARILDLLERK